VHCICLSPHGLLRGVAVGGLKRYQRYQGQDFKPELVPTSLLAMGKRIHEKFTSKQRTELWSEDTIHASLRQIEFYHECGFFNNPLEGQNLCDQLLATIREIRECAASGYNRNGNEPFHLFKNEILIADNTFLFRFENKREVFINHNTLNVLSTTQESFCRQTENYLLNLLDKATKISLTSEKEPAKFFNTIEEKIKTLKKRIGG
jgi:hypothetical protein